MTDGSMRIHTIVTARSRERDIPAPESRRTPAPRESRDSGRARDARQVEEERFRRVYETIARENREADKTSRHDRNAVDSAHRREDIGGARIAGGVNEGADERTGNNGASHADVRNTDHVRSAGGDKAEGPESDSAAAQAWMTIRESLTTVSKTFGLDLIGRIEDLDVATPSEGVVEQFAEILTVLKKLAEMLEQAGSQNMALSLSDKQIEPGQALALGKGLRTEAFRLEFAFSMLDVGAAVSEAVARKEQQPFYSGIPTATNPSSLSSTPQIGAIISDAFADGEDRIEAIIARLSALAETREVKKTALPAQAAPNGDAGKGSGVQEFDSLIMRRILKIDAQDGQTQSDVKDGSTGNDNQKPRVIPGLQMQASPVFQQRLEIAELSAETTVDAGVRAQPRFQQIDGASRLAAHPMRTLEESVMTQVSDRLHTALRNGVHEVRIHLRPESLGEVRLRIQMDGDVVMARIHVESQQVKQIVESNLQSLRDALSEQNLQAGAFDVNVDRGSGQENPFADESGKQGKIAGASGTNAPSAETGNGGAEIGRETGRRWGSNSVEYFA